MTAIAVQHRKEILHQIAQGKRLADLSSSLGITPQAISKSLQNDPEYRSAIETGLEVRLDKAESGIETARFQVDVARAGTLHRAVAWRAERECPNRWGSKQVVDVMLRIDVSDRLQARAADLLEHVVSPPQIEHEEGALETMDVLSNDGS